MKTYGCIDNVLDNKRYNELIHLANLLPFLSGNASQYQEIIHNFHSIQWLFGFDGKEKGEGIYYTDACVIRPQLQYIIFEGGNPPYTTTISQYYITLLKYILHKHFSTISHYSIDRIKLNLGLQTSKGTKYLVPHKDHTVLNHLSMTLFIGESDGEHLVFKETDNHLREKQSTPLTPIEQYAHKNNRLVYNTGQYHCNYDPVEYAFRLALNFVVTFAV